MRIGFLLLISCLLNGFLPGKYSDGQFHLLCLSGKKKKVNDERSIREGEELQTLRSFGSLMKKKMKN